MTGFGYHVQVLSGPDAGASCPISNGLLTVGTHPDAGLHLTDRTVSRFHLELRAEEGGVRVTDTGSSNGTFLAGARVTELLVPRDSAFTIGTTVLRVTCEVAAFPPDGADSNAGSPLAESLVGASPAWKRLVRVLGRVAPSDATVLLVGETGSGKERVARALHAASPRKGGPLVVVDCRTLGPELIESELFGHLAGAFTDAVSDRKGAFRQAEGGTLLLDAVGELPLELQVRLLRALETRRVKPVGGEAEIPFDVRILAATDRPLEPELARGHFRRDLYFRLAVVVLELPPLRARREDIPILARHFARELGRPDFELPPDQLQKWATHTWPGNVRELCNAVSRLLAGGPAQTSSPRPEAFRGVEFKDAKERLLDSFTREYLEALLARHAGNIGAAAKEAGLARTYLYTLMKKMGLG